MIVCLSLSESLGIQEGLVFICDEYRCVLELGISFMANCIKNALEMEA